MFSARRQLTIWWFLFAIVASPHCLAQRFAIAVVPKRSQAPSPRYHAAVYSFSGSNTVVLFGGRSKTRAYGDTWLYNATTREWSQVSERGPSARFGCLFAGLDYGGSHGQYMYLIGGRNGKGVVKSSFVWSFHLATKTWTVVKTKGQRRDDPSGQSVFARFAAVGGATTNNKIVISHGYDGKQMMSDTYEVSFSSPFEAKVARKLHDSTPTYRIGSPRAAINSAGVVTDENDLVLVGGCYQLGLCPNQDAWSLDAKTNDWRHLSKGPSPRMYASIAKALPVEKFSKNRNHTVVVWGGLESSRQTSTVERSSAVEIDILDLKANTWSREIARGPLSTDIKRFGSSMVTVGTGDEKNPYKYFIFGGISEGGNLSSMNLEVEFIPRETPDRITSTARLFTHLHTHGILMFMSHGLLLPFGAVSARYVRALPAILWYRIHVTVLCLGGILAWIGVFFAIKGANSIPNHTHAILGILVMVMTTVEFAASIPPMRPNANAGTPRTVWERIHSTLGWTCICLGLVNALLGVFLLVLPPVVWITFIAGISAFVVLLIVLESLRKIGHFRKSKLYVLSEITADSERSDGTPASCDGVINEHLIY